VIHMRDDGKIADVVHALPKASPAEPSLAAGKTSIIA